MVVPLAYMITVGLFLFIFVLPDWDKVWGSRIYRVSKLIIHKNKKKVTKWGLY